jgi:hypothetical protein
MVQPVADPRRLNLRKQRIQLSLFFPLFLCILFISCDENSKNPESELIKKINAVQQQVMAQGNVSDEEEQALLSLCSIVSQDEGLANYSPDNRMILKDVEIAPVYNGCEGLSKEETKECFKGQVSTFIMQEFNVNISKGLNLSEPKQVAAFFVIDGNGERTGMKVRNSDVTVQAEILRVLRKIPKMKPAIHNGNNVSVLCSIIIKYGNEIEVDVVYIPERPND